MGLRPIKYSMLYGMGFAHPLYIILYSDLFSFLLASALRASGRQKKDLQIKLCYKYGRGLCPLPYNVINFFSRKGLCPFQERSLYYNYLRGFAPLIIIVVKIY